MENITQARRKSKPDRDFPLWLHPSGRWCRKIKGTAYYFGRDRDAALEEWLRVKDDLLAGRERPVAGGGLTVADLSAKVRPVQVSLTHVAARQELRVLMGELGLGAVSAPLAAAG